MAGTHELLARDELQGFKTLWIRAWCVCAPSHLCWFVYSKMLGPVNHLQNQKLCKISEGICLLVLTCTVQSHPKNLQLSPLHASVTMQCVHTNNEKPRWWKTDGRHKCCLERTKVITTNVPCLCITGWLVVKGQRMMNLVSRPGFRPRLPPPTVISCLHTRLQCKHVHAPMCGTTLPCHRASTLGACHQGTPGIPPPASSLKHYIWQDRPVQDIIATYAAITQCNRLKW